jgi:predicted nucleic acid-binding protein
VRRAVFVDTSAWFAVVDDQDAWHVQARRLLQELARQRRPLLTTNWVAGETYTLMRMRLGHAAAMAFLGRVRTSPLIRIQYVPEAWESSAEELLARFQDQDFSYVDALSCVTMRRLGLTEAFAYDHHFAVAGFVCLQDG